MVPATPDFDVPIIRKHAFDGTPLDEADWQTFHYPFGNLTFAVGTTLGALLWDCSLKLDVLPRREFLTANPQLTAAQKNGIARTRKITKNWQDPKVQLGDNWERDEKYAPYLRGGVYDNSAFEIDLEQYKKFRVNRNGKFFIGYDAELQEHRIRDKSPGGTVRSKSRSQRAKSTSTSNKGTSTTASRKKAASVTVGGSRKAKSWASRSVGTRRSTGKNGSAGSSTVRDNVSEADELVASGSKAAAKKRSGKLSTKGKGKAPAGDNEDEGEWEDNEEGEDDDGN